MSIVCGAIKNGEVAIAADTQSSFGSLKVSPTHCKSASKLITYQDCIIGTVGWVAMKNILEHAFQRSDLALKFTSPYEIFDSFLLLQQVLKDDYFIETKEDDKQPVESSQVEILIINPQGLFEVGSFRNVSEFHTYWAIGSGSELAIGAMHATYSHATTAESVVLAGSAAAVEFDESCCLPIESNVMSLKML